MQSRGNINENMEIREQSSNYRTHNASQPITNINDNYPSLRRACNILLRGRLSNAAVRRGHALKSGSSREKASAKSPNNLNRLSRDSLFLPAARCDRSRPRFDEHLAAIHGGRVLFWINFFPRSFHARGSPQRNFL